MTARPAGVKLHEELCLLLGSAALALLGAWQAALRWAVSVAVSAAVPAASCACGGRGAPGPWQIWGRVDAGGVVAPCVAADAAAVVATAAAAEAGAMDGVRGSCPAAPAHGAPQLVQLALQGLLAGLCASQGTLKEARTS
jgi:hypothetical protein